MSLVLKNGVVVGWGNSSFVVGGVILTGIRTFTADYNQKKENVYGSGHEPVGRGRGNIEYPEGTMEILEEEWKAIVAAAPNRNPLQIAPFNVPIVYDNNVLPSNVLSNVEFTGIKRNYRQGDSMLYFTVGFIYAGINE